MSRAYHARAALYVQRDDVVTLYASALVVMREEPSDRYTYAYADVLWLSLRLRDEEGGVWGLGDLLPDERDELEMRLRDEAHGQDGERMRRERLRREADEDLSPLLAGSLAIARARNVARDVIAEMAVWGGDNEPEAAE